LSYEADCFLLYSPDSYRDELRSLFLRSIID